ncbi:MAG: 4-amino-4-deoxychorismate lyase [Saprospiraceae bacterium]|nr:MAG: 4-amino-4-deoxychorismate lyase [Saprospiraceae bacterium]
MPIQRPLLESIRLENGALQNLDQHRARMASSLTFLGLPHEIAWSNSWTPIPISFQQGLWKFRLLYANDDFEVQIEPYCIRPVKSLQLVLADHIDYPVKYADRQAIQALFQNRTYGDGILLVKNGLLTDTSYANVALFDGKKWVTPTLPLLAGTRRAGLIKAGKIFPKNIPATALSNYQKIQLFNAMMDFGEGPVIDVENIGPFGR